MYFHLMRFEVPIGFSKGDGCFIDYAAFNTFFILKRVSLYHNGSMPNFWTYVMHNKFENISCFRRNVSGYWEFVDECNVLKTECVVG